MQTVSPEMSSGCSLFINILPWLILAGIITVIVMAIRFFNRLGSNVKAIRDLLEKQAEQEKK